MPVAANPAAATPLATGEYIVHPRLLLGRWEVGRYGSTMGGRSAERKIASTLQVIDAVTKPPKSRRHGSPLRATYASREAWRWPLDHMSPFLPRHGFLCSSPVAQPGLLSRRKSQRRHGPPRHHRVIFLRRNGCTCWTLTSSLMVRIRLWQLSEDNAHI